MAHRLPIESIIPELKTALRQSNRVVLRAETGAGKTTGVPPALVNEPWLEGKKIVMLEPRRLAARMAAEFIAENSFGAHARGIVGYTIRHESTVTPETRIDIVTEAILTRRLHQDPELADVGLIIFDEFHERNLNSDLGLTLSLDVQEGLRPDLKILVMSATLDAEKIARFLGGCPSLHCPGRVFPVATALFPPRRDESPVNVMARAVQTALRETTKNVLVFQPGVAEINRLTERLNQSSPPNDTSVLPLHGGLPWDAQKEAVRPSAPGRRKVIVATNIAETSLTIAGIEAVVDSGFTRYAEYDPGSGCQRLVTRRVTRDAADQRRGRAGRLGPGKCWRVWSAADDAMLRDHRLPEILTADLAQLVMDVSLWGVADPAQLSWLDEPPQAAWDTAARLLRLLNALDTHGRLTPHGKAITRLGVNPRLGHMLLHGKAVGAASLALAMAALLEERDILPRRLSTGHANSDIRVRLDMLKRRQKGTEHVWKSIEQFARRSHTPPPDGESDWRMDQAGALTALAFPDRVARKRPGGGYVLGSGKGAFLPDEDSLAKEEFLAVAATNGDAESAKIFLAAPLTLADIQGLFHDQIESVDHVSWDQRTQSVQCCRQETFGALVLRESPLKYPDPALILAEFLHGVRQAGLRVLPWTNESETWRRRVMFLRSVYGPDSDWPDLSDEGLLDSLDHWLGPFVHGMRRLNDLRTLNMLSLSQSLLPYPLQARLEREAPAFLDVPSGSRIRLDYSGEIPVLPVKLQEMFGLNDTPVIAGGRVKVLLHLLDPGRKPVQVTRDLRNFWKETYFQVRKDLRGRYPKHPWPEDPATATPTRKTTRQLKK
ncbi:MAG: ATP-dependent helicase HrpB [Lentisphaeria bacterium]|nr:ATP-dependent helicase HrpB [Lentisphaeria bacterium]